jgi:DnaJ-class molecular chaperone
MFKELEDFRSGRTPLAIIIEMNERIKKLESKLNSYKTVTCRVCEGTGYVEILQSSWGDNYNYYMSKGYKTCGRNICTECNGAGEVKYKIPVVEANHE